MFCKNCGAEIPDGSVFCGNCGMQTSVEQPRQEPVNQYSNTENNAYQSYQQPRYAQPEQPVYNSEPVYNAQPVQPVSSVNPTPWIVLNILMIVLGCCCSISGILGIIGLVFAIQSNNAVKAGDAVTAENKAKTAKILFFVALGLFVLQTVLGIVSGIFTSSMENVEDYLYYNF